ncbi:MAG: hypothetical protein WCJ25_02625 [Candidatus Moraniibacteriota bacterium]
MNPLVVPARANVTRKSNSVRIVFAEPVETFWDDVCIAIREACKRHPNYRIPVDNGGVGGRTDQGETIPINSLGKWLFGTPGYRSHKLLDGEMRSGQFVVRFYFPNEVPNEVQEMLEALTPESIRKQCHFWGNREHKDQWISTRGGI